MDHTCPRRLLAGLLLALLGPGAAADIIHYKDGRSVEGVVLEQTASEVKVETAFGTITIARSKIARIEEKLTPTQELAQRRAQIPAGDVGALFQLAGWAEEQKLRKEARALWLEIVAIAPDHRGAQEKLGRVLVDDLWMEPEQVEAYLAAKGAEMEAQGLMFHEGAWLPKAEVMQLRGFVEVHGEWLERREAETRLLLEDAAQQAQITFEALAGKWVTLFDAVLDVETREAMVWDLDAEVDAFCSRLRLNEDERASLLRYDIPILFLPDLDSAGRLLASGLLARFPHQPAADAQWQGRTAFGTHWPRPLLVFVEGEQLDVGGDRPALRRGITFHMLADLLVERHAGERNAPPWARAGLGAWFEGATNYFATTTIVTADADPGAVPPTLWVAGWENHAEWRDALREADLVGSLPQLAGILSRDARDHDSRVIGICWSFTDFLLDRHATEFSDYLRTYDLDPTLSDRSPRRLHERAWERSFAVTVDEIEDEWHSWALARSDRFPTELLDRR